MRTGSTGLGLFAVMAALGCSDGHDVEALQLETEVSPIINGTTDFTGWDNERLRTVILRRADGAWCSATVLRPNIVLTAQHCVNSNGLVVGSALLPRDLSVNGVAGIDLWVDDIDAAVVQFASNVVNQWEDFTALDPFDPSVHLGDGLMMMGFGADENGTAGTLRRGAATVRGVDEFYETPGRTVVGMRLANAVSGTATAPGDSGGPLWGDSFRYPRTVVGIASASDQVAFGESYHAQVRDYRFEMRSWMFDRFNSSLSVSFDRASDLSNNFRSLQAATGTPCNWQVSGGALVQVANAPQCFMIQNGVFENVVVSVGMQGNDDDSMGILFRYVDKDNHYRCEASRAFRSVTIVRRRNGTDRDVATAAWTGSFNGLGMVVRAVEDVLECSVGNVTVKATGHQTFPIGKVGLYNHFNKGGQFTHWGASSLRPVDGSW